MNSALVGIHYEACPNYYEGSLDADGPADCVWCKAALADHDGHDISLEFDMADHENDGFIWCETCQEIVYVEEED